jgi:hypothetical protein
MGFAKYREDIQRRYNDDMYLKYASDNWGKKSLIKLQKAKESTSINEEFEDIIGRIRNIKLWIIYDENLLNIFRSSLIYKQISDQIKYLNEVLDLHIDKSYDAKFDSLRANRDKQNENNDTDFEKELNNDYLNYLLAFAVNLKNKNYDDTLEIRKFHKDLSLFLRIIRDIDTEKIRIPLIKFVRETLLHEKEIKVKICKRCRKETYEDFHICIYCNNNMGEK